MRKVILFLSLLSLISVISCRQQKMYVITGDVTGFPDSTKVYLQNNSTEEIFDSAFVLDGKFIMTGVLLNEPEQITLHSTMDKEVVYAGLFIGNEKVKIKGDVSDFPWHVSITGSKTQDEMNDFSDITKPYDIKRDSLVRVLFKLTPDEQQNMAKEIWGKVKLLDKITDSLTIEYIKTHYNSYPGIINLGYLKSSFSKDTVRALYNKLTDRMKSTRYAKAIKVYLDEKISEIGDDFHDFVALTNEGDSVRLSNYMGQYILLNFTSAYCGPCIQSAEELRMIDSSYADWLQIVSFSTDVNKENWLKALKRDNISWISLWDGKGNYSETMIKYGVEGVPSFFLIDPKGIIVDIWSGYGKGSLEKKLERLKPF